MIIGAKKGILKEQEIQVEREWMDECTVELGGKIWKIYTVYNKGGSKERLQEIENAVADEKEDLMIIGGDFNARIGEKGDIGWVDVEGEETNKKSKDQTINKEGEELLKMVDDKGWVILNGNKEGDQKGEWTFERGTNRSVIDYGITNLRSWDKIEAFRVIRRADSDHHPITVEIEEVGRRENSKKKREMIQDWSEKGIQVFKENTKNLECDSTGVENKWRELKDKISDAINMRKRGRAREAGWKPWWDQECWEGKKKLGKIVRKSRGEENGDELKRARIEYKQLCKEKIEEWKNKEEMQLKEITTDSQAWKYVNKFRKKREGVERDIKIEEWREHFKKLLEGNEEAVIDTREDIDKLRGAEKDIEKVTREEIARQIKKMKKDKAAGRDQIKNEAWMYGGEKVFKEIARIIEMTWEGEGYPEEWKEGIIVPIKKKGDSKNVESYRGVTLACTASKIYAGILNERLIKETDKVGGWSETQFGFRKNRGAIDCIKIAKHIIGKRLAKKRGKVFAFFIDLKAAFDKVDRGKLWKCLKDRGISEGLIDRIREVYKETKCVVKVGENTSKCFWTTKGVRQGCPMSPTLFSIYLADLAEEIRKGQGGVKVGKKRIVSLEYADDVVLLAEKEEGLGAMIKALEKYLEGKKLSLNVDKSKVVIFKKGGGREPRNKRIWWWKGEKIEEVKEIRYLGYILQRNNRNEQHVKERVKKANVIMKWVWGFGERKFKGDWKWRCKLFDTLVKSVLSYGVEIWGFREWDGIEKIEERYLRWVLGVERSTPGYIVREEWKRNKFRIEAGIRAIKYECKEAVRDREILMECEKERKEDERMNIWTDSSVERKEYLWRCGVSEWEWERMNGETGKLKDRDIEVHVQERNNRIERARYNPRYKELRTIGRPRYFKEGKSTNGDWMKVIARARCGNEESTRKYWKQQENKCALCEDEEESWEHWIARCKGINRWEGSVNELLDEDGKGYAWLKSLMELKETKKTTNCMIE